MELKVLLTGAQGQLGRALQGYKPRHWSLTALGSGQLDITDAPAVRERVKALRPGLIINAAAYNAVDRAERERRRVLAVNAQGPLNLARAANEAGARLVHVSTDYVFDGRAGRPYREDDAPNPLNIYGESKLRGEQWVLGEQPHALVLRTAWVFSAEGPNFVQAMLRAALQGRPLRVVDDQTGAPTFAGDLANAIVALAGLAMAEAGGRGAARSHATAVSHMAAAAGSHAEATTVGHGEATGSRPAAGIHAEEGGIYHYSGATALTRYDFARAIFDAADHVREALRADAGSERSGGPAPRGAGLLPPGSGTVEPPGSSFVEPPGSGSIGHPGGGTPGGSLGLVSPISSSQYPTAALRPAYSVLDCGKMAALGIEPRPLEDSLPGVVRALLAKR